MTDDNQPTAPNSGGLVKRVLPIAFIAGAIGLGYAFGLQNYLNLETLKGFQEPIENNKALAVLIFLLAYAGLVAVSFPGATILTIASGFLFGQWAGTFAAWIGATTGATLIFLLVKTSFGDLFKSKASGFIEKMEKGFREDELNYMFLLRLVPVFPFFAVNIAAGVLGVKLRNFFIGTILGILPGSFVYVSIGNAIREGTATAAETGFLDVFTQPAVYLPFIGLAVLGALPIVLKRFGGKQAQSLGDGS